jgi:multicomponent K+:H+ antiporter subunit D
MEDVIQQENGSHEPFAHTSNIAAIAGGHADAVAAPVHAAQMQRWITWGVLTVLIAIGGILILRTAANAYLRPRGLAAAVWHRACRGPLGGLFLAVTAVLAFCAGIYSADQEDERSALFYPLFLFQVMGINGAFLTGDLFNLFVFFEILLIASYALLVHGGGKEKTKAGFHYVTLNLIGSALFLVALGTFTERWARST